MRDSSTDNVTPGQGKGQARPKFDWPKLRKAIEFYEREQLCYLPAGWGRKNPALDSWEKFETRLPTMAEKADWFHEGKPTSIGVVCGAISGGLVILAFNDPDGAREFFGDERWQKLLQSTFITKSIRGYHVWLRSDTPIKSEQVGKGKNQSWLEIRSGGNFTMAPPSLHPSGVLYQAIGVDHIYKPDDLAGFIVRRLAELGLREPLQPKEFTGRRKKHPPCLEVISNGVEEQQRDAAALALARHYLIQAYEPEEILWLLQEWDKKNKPPLGDAFFLEARVRIAENYRGLVCPLILDKPTVSTFCVGDSKCDWPKPKKSEKMSKPSAKEKPERSDEFNELAIEKLLESCAFMRHCQDDAATLSEPHWWSMCDILSFFGGSGKEKAHELSEPHDKYTKETTDTKLEYAEKAKDREVGPHTCVHIEKNLGFPCPEDCLAKKWGLKSPVVLATRLARTAGLPIIIVTSRFLREKTADTVAAVEQANNPPQIFERSGYLVRIAQDEFGSPYVETLTESACRGFIERAANYVRVNDKGEMIPLPAPPLDIVRDFMSLPTRNLPPLLGVTEVPVLRSDGSIVTEPGYDEATRLYYQPAIGLNLPVVPDNPRPEELEAAVAFIQEPLLDFPFDSTASRTNALAVLVTPLYRSMIAGLVPLCLIDKPQPGTGAGLLSDVIAIIATGRPAVMMAPPKTDEECEKRLASILLHGQAVITLDNIEGYLYFPSLAMLITATTFQTRILGQSKEVRLPNRSTFVVTGNNVRLGGDMPRRCYLSRMDARLARPWMRDPKSFKYHHLMQWVKENRGRLLAATLTMARAWVQAGRPIPDGLPPLGGFEDWENTVGGILTHAGFVDFLGNLDSMYSKSDVETPQWEGFFATWQEVLGEDAVTTARVVESINENSILADALPDTIDRDPKKINRSLSHSLARRTGVRYSNGLMVTKSERMVHHVTAWQVINYQEEAEKAEKAEKRGISNQNLSSYELGTGGGLGGLPYRQRSCAPKPEEGMYKNGLEHNPPNPLLATTQAQRPNPPFFDDLWAGMPDYPKEPCHACGGTDFWPDFKGKRFVCGRCHPKPQEIDMEV
ncbi:hypothetical protein ES708_13615 [subsurface metagenome]